MDIMPLSVVELLVIGAVFDEDYPGCVGKSKLFN
jgi:hypothetical protein